MDLPMQVCLLNLLDVSYWEDFILILAESASTP